MAFLAPKDKNRQLEDLPQANFGRVPERFLLSVRTNSLTENFVYSKLRPLFGFVLLQRIFHLPMLFTIFIQGFSILLFSFINKDNFSC